MSHPTITPAAERATPEQLAAQVAELTRRLDVMEAYFLALAAAGQPAAVGGSGEVRRRRIEASGLQLIHGGGR